MKAIKIGFIGAGNMAQAIFGRLIKTGTPARDISIFEPNVQQADMLVAGLGVQAVAENKMIYENSDVIVLAIKPQVMPVALQSIQGVCLKPNAFILSIAAGVPIALMQGWMGAQHPIVRVMPNTPALVGAAISGLYADAQVNDDQRQIAESILRAVGSIIWVDDEALIDAVTAVSGSGPAYFFYFIEALERAALEHGLSPEQARLLSLETAFGAARLALESDANVATLRERVTSPGGTTRAALDVFEGRQLADIVAQAVSAAAQRARELARLAK